jgi:ABC-type uncharacterized transport system YnjBCD ATPase subunit
MNHIKATALSVDLGRTRIVDGIDLEIAGGSVIGVIGPNGAGKSTLLRALAGLIPCHGDVSLNGVSVTRLSLSALARMRAYLAQDSNIHWPLTVCATVGLGRYPHRDALATSGLNAVTRALQAANVVHFADRPVTELSGGERMIVTRNLSNDVRLKPGSEVLEIGGHATAQILSELMVYARADGGNDIKCRALLEIADVDRFETFDVFHGLLFPPKNGMFKISVRPMGSSAAQSVEVKALGLAERRAAMPPQSKDKTGPPWTLSLTPLSIAILTMPNWAIYNSTWNRRGFLDDAFAEIKGRRSRAFIVDLRGNEGGLDCGNDIIARLIDKDMLFESYERRVRFRHTLADLEPFLDIWDPSFKSLGKDAIDIGGGFFRLNPESDGKDGSLIRPKGPRFNGDLIVLTNAQNSSATFQFAQTIQTHGLGRLCGGPTGGNQRGINGGALFFLRLPASGLEVDVPLVGHFPSVPKPDAGLTPDIFAEPTIEDIASGRDHVMEKAISVLHA